MPADPLLEETKEISFPLFSMTVEISRESKQLYVTPLEPEFEVNLSALEPVLGENYLDLVSALGQLEAKGHYQLPKQDEKIFQEIWRLVSGHLGTSGAKFGRESFRLQEKRLSLVAKTNYFLAEDLRKLASASEEDLLKTSISTWISDEDLSHEDGIPQESELYFPFAYDRYQLRAVGRLRNKASMIQGPPGCGKSQTISNLVCHLAATGKRVLFVSQKAQALKVVKDRLKDLKIPNLYGYIPNPASQSLTKEDEEDGAGPQLARMAAYVQELERRLDQNDNSNKLGPFSAAVNQAKAKLNAQHDLERKICQTHKVIEELADYEVPCNEPNLLRTVFTAEVWEKLESAATHLNSVAQEVSELQSTQPERPPQWPGKLALVDFSTAAGSKAISELGDYAASHRYDRRWSLVRSLNTMVLRFRKGPALKALPREVLDLVDEILKSPASRSETVRQLSQLHDEVRLHELQKEYEKLVTQFWTDANAAGVASDNWEDVMGLEANTGKTKPEVVKHLHRLLGAKADFTALLGAKSDLAAERALIAVALGERRGIVSAYIQRILDRRLRTLWSQGNSFRGLVQKLSTAFGKSKKAFKTFDQLRRDPKIMRTMIEMVPIWIMELDDASRLLPLEQNLFDYVVLDEASQCNIAYTMPAMYRAGSAVFVGDTEQMRDSTILFKSNNAFETLASQYGVPLDMQIKPTGAAVQSVMHIAAVRGVTPTFLQYHYRSPKELIEFSNAKFYRPKGKDLFPLNRKYRTIPPTSLVMQIHEVDGKPHPNEESEKENYREAEAILNLYQRLSILPEYKGLSFGVLSFFNAQVQLIRRVFEEAGVKENGDHLKISVIDGIQGDEKDIILYSFAVRDAVSAGKRYRPLAGRGGDIQGDISAGRVNVAFSRARAQTHSFISMPRTEFPSSIWIKDYLDHVHEFGAVEITSDLKPFDSFFEQDVHTRLVALAKSKNFRIDNQVISCGFVIDLVVTNTVTGEALAIECDGPTHFTNENESVYVESDIERQLALEAAGWNFERLRYSDWIEDGFDKKAAIKGILAKVI